MQLPDFAAFPSTVPGHGAAAQPTGGAAQTPEEVLESSYQLLRHQLAGDLLERVRSCTPMFFEGLVLDLLVAMGYGGSREDAAKVGRTGDGGIDGIIKEDKLGLDAVYVQAKRWQGTVGRPIVQAFAGSLEGHKANKGVLITTSTFSRDAEEFVGRLSRRIVLIDGGKLAGLMIDHGVGVTGVATYTVKKVDSDYFEEE
jgi:restriction system protein